MTSFSFNILYILESLNEDEIKTGKNLYDELCSNLVRPTPPLVIYKSISSGREWDECINEIYHDCIQKGVKPIIHLEMHGDDTGIGFINGDTRDHRTLCTQFSGINFACGCNMLLTLGVCEGLNILKGMQVTIPMPYCVALGSFEELWNVDIELRFTEFYKELFSSYDLNKAYAKLLQANSKYTEKYRPYPIDELFYIAYNGYLQKQCNKEAVKERAKSTVGNSDLHYNNRRERRGYEKGFIKDEKRTRLAEYKRIARDFFATEKYPNNFSRFNIPSTFDELKKRYQSIIKK